MAIKIGSILIDIKADTASLLEGMKKGEAQMSSFKNAVGVSLGDVNKNMAALGQSAAAAHEVVGRSLQGITDRADLLRDAFLGLGAAFSLKEIIGTASKIENAKIALEAATGSAKKGGEEFEFIGQVADKLGLNHQELAQSYGKLMLATRGTTLEGQKTRDMFVGLATAAKGMGGDTAKVNELVDVYTRTLSRNTVEAKNLGRALASFPGGFHALAQSVGVTDEQFKKMLETATFKTQPVLYNLSQILGKQMAEAADHASDSISSWQARVVNAADSVIVSMGVEGGVTGALKKMEAALKTPEAQALAHDLGQVLATGARLAGDAIGFLAQHTRLLRDAIIALAAAKFLGWILPLPAAALNLAAGVVNVSKALYGMAAAQEAVAVASTSTSTAFAFSSATISASGTAIAATTTAVKGLSFAWLGLLALPAATLVAIIETKPGDAEKAVKEGRFGIRAKGYEETDKIVLPAIGRALGVTDLRPLGANVPPTAPKPPDFAYQTSEQRGATSGLFGNLLGDKPGLAAELLSARAKLTGILGEIAKGEQDYVGTIEEKYRKLLINVRETFAKFPQLRKEFIGVELQLEVAKAAEIKRLDEKLLQDSNKAYEKFINDRNILTGTSKRGLFPELLPPTPVLPQLREDRIGAALDEFRGGKGGGKSAKLTELELIYKFGEEVFKNTTTAAEKYQIEIGKLNDALNTLDPITQKSVISQETYNRAMQNMREAINGNLDLTVRYNEELRKYNELKKQGLLTTQAEIEMQRQLKIAQADAMAQSGGVGGGFRGGLLAFNAEWNKIGPETFAATKNVLQGMQNGFAKFFESVFSGTKSIAQAFAQLGRDMLSSIVTALAQMLAKWIATHIAMLILSKVFGQDDPQEQATKQIAANVAIATSNAGVSGSEVFMYALAESLGDIPYALAMGALASGIGLGFAGLASAAGGMKVDRDQLALVHTDEHILPAHIARAYEDRAATNRGGDSFSGGHTFHFQINGATDANEVADKVMGRVKTFFRTGGVMR